ncbi:hypothetical protein Tco_0099406 [Tanacetum coccineum]
MDPYNQTSIKLPILDTGKFEQWKAPPEEAGKGIAGEGSAKKKGRIVALTAEDMQKRKNDVKARTTLLLALTHHNKTSYELAHDKKPDLTFF